MRRTFIITMNIECQLFYNLCIENEYEKTFSFTLVAATFLLLLSVSLFVTTTNSSMFLWKCHVPLYNLDRMNCNELHFFLEGVFIGLQATILPVLRAH